MTTACAIESRRRQEPLIGTASRARRWILLEQPGAWSADALHGSGLPAEVMWRLDHWARELPARILLIRRPLARFPQTRAPARLRTSPPGRTLMVGCSSPGSSFLESFSLERIEQVGDIDLSPLASGEGVGGRRLDEPHYLVCTNGRHDPCCARDGIPVAKALATLVGERVWECSHVGGDRFAGNLVCLPDGHFYGHLDPATAEAAVLANEAGRLLVDHWRGRSCHPFPVQAAEGLVRRRLGLDAASALRVVGVQHEGKRITVRFARGGEAQAEAEIEAVVAVAADEQARALTCGGVPSRPPAYELLSLRELAAE